MTSVVCPEIPGRKKGTWPPSRKKRPQARNARTKRRLRSVACDICPVVLFHSCGSQISGGDIIRRPCHLGKLTFVLANPDATSRAEKTPRTAEKSDERPPYLDHLGYLFGGIDLPVRDLATRKSPSECRFGGAASVMCPVAFVILE